MIYAKFNLLTSDCLGNTIAPYHLYLIIFPAT